MWLVPTQTRRRKAECATHTLACVGAVRTTATFCGVAAEEPLQYYLGVLLHCYNIYQTAEKRHFFVKEICYILLFMLQGGDLWLTNQYHAHGL